MHRIVVGVDGSDSSLGALRWAVDVARLTGGEVDAVHAWSHHALTYAPGMLTPPMLASDDLVADATTPLDRACDSLNERDVVVNRIVEQGPAARRLLESAEGADLLVVGSRGRGGFTGLLLGSVSQQRALHAPCPVVIIRGRVAPLSHAG
jgi:nucleotide-binding universal stress UspA family protein